MPVAHSNRRATEGPESGPISAVLAGHRPQKRDIFRQGKA